MGISRHLIEKTALWGRQGIPVPRVGSDKVHLPPSSVKGDPSLQETPTQQPPQRAHLDPQFRGHGPCPPGGHATGECRFWTWTWTWDLGVLPKPVSSANRGPDAAHPLCLISLFASVFVFVGEHFISFEFGLFPILFSFF